MIRRQFIASLGVGSVILLEGCSSPAEVDPDIESVKRLGAAPPVSMAVSAEKDFRETSERSFEEWATRRATDRATDRLRAILENESLTGEGVSIGQGSVHLEDLGRPTGDDRLLESEFHRAVEIGPRVFHYHHYSRDGELLSKPEVEFQAIVEAIPRSFEVTMNYPDEAYVAVLPVMCRRGWIQNT